MFAPHDPAVNENPAPDAAFDYLTPLADPPADIAGWDQERRDLAVRLLPMLINVHDLPYTNPATFRRRIERAIEGLVLDVGRLAHWLYLMADQTLERAEGTVAIGDQDYLVVRCRRSFEWQGERYAAEIDEDRRRILLAPHATDEVKVAAIAEARQRLWSRVGRPSTPPQPSCCLQPTIDAAVLATRGVLYCQPDPGGGAVLGRYLVGDVRHGSGGFGTRPASTRRRCSWNRLLRLQICHSLSRTTSMGSRAPSVARVGTSNGLSLTEAWRC